LIEDPFAIGGEGGAEHELAFGAVDFLAVGAIGVYCGDAVVGVVGELATIGGEADAVDELVGGGDGLGVAAVEIDGVEALFAVLVDGDGEAVFTGHEQAGGDEIAESLLGGEFLAATGFHVIKPEVGLALRVVFVEGFGAPAGDEFERHKDGAAAVAEEAIGQPADVIGLVEVEDFEAGAIGALDAEAAAGTADAFAATGGEEELRRGRGEGGGEQGAAGEHPVSVGIFASRRGRGSAPVVCGGPGGDRR
jgi:hypothetical protein